MDAIERLVFTAAAAVIVDVAINCFQLRIGKFGVLFVLCIQSILYRFDFGGDKLLLKNAYQMPLYS